MVALGRGAGGAGAGEAGFAAVVAFTCAAGRGVGRVTRAGVDAIAAALAALGVTALGGGLGATTGGGVTTGSGGGAGVVTGTGGAATEELTASDSCAAVSGFRTRHAANAPPAITTPAPINTGQSPDFAVRLPVLSQDAWVAAGATLGAGSAS
jgi:hypothetical protein